MGTDLFAKPGKPLSLGDLLDSGVASHSGAGRLQRIRVVHHNVAESLARGLTHEEVYRITGMDVGRQKTLLDDPTFAGLIAYYKAQSNPGEINTLARLGQLHIAAVEELTSRIEASPEVFENKELIRVAAFAADRSGFGPLSKTQSMHLHLTPADMAELKGGANGEAVKILTPEDRRAALRLVESSGPVAQDEAEGHAAEGAVVRDQGGEEVTGPTAGGP